MCIGICQTENGVLLKGPSHALASASWASTFQRNNHGTSDSHGKSDLWWKVSKKKTGSTRSDQYYHNARSSPPSENDAVLVMQQRKTSWTVTRGQERIFIISGGQDFKNYSDQLEEDSQTMIHATIDKDTLAPNLKRTAEESVSPSWRWEGYMILRSAIIEKV